ncbi:hypothetical protein BVIR_2021 [Blastochloris viridis]|uniref:Uncharacterized protein n=1 Tax=Blastochloris viridis TaxID=1079 RepID=A0A0P0IRW8_BLAVI|nr:hypothetical protein BVIR_2021 [Blastochloris viridis]CUU42454.1 hypothetical protein BVIRIDIS_14660 [Blastochloris viridis]
MRGRNAAVPNFSSTTPADERTIAVTGWSGLSKLRAAKEANAKAGDKWRRNPFDARCPNRNSQAHSRRKHRKWSRAVLTRAWLTRPPGAPGQARLGRLHARCARRGGGGALLLMAVGGMRRGEQAEDVVPVRHRKSVVWRNALFPRQALVVIAKAAGDSSRARRPRMRWRDRPRTVIETEPGHGLSKERMRRDWRAIPGMRRPQRVLLLAGQIGELASQARSTTA